MPVKPTYEELEKRVGELEQTEKALEESEERFKAIFEESRDAIFIVDKKARFAYVNSAASELTGYTRAELLTMQITDLHDPNDIRSYNRYFSRILEGESIVTEADILRKDGIRVPAEFSNTRVSFSGRIYMHTIARDITERKRIEEELNFQAMLLNQIQDHVTATDLKGSIIYVNDAEIRTMKRSREELIGTSIRIYGEDAGQGATQTEIMEHTLKNGEWTGEVINFDRDGNKVVMFCRTRLVRDKHGKPVSMVGISTDITQRKKAELQLLENEQRFRELFNHMSSGVAIYESPDDGQSFVFKDLNQAGLDSAGMKKEDVVGRKVREVFPGVESMGLFSVFQRVFRSGIPEHHPCSFYKDDKLEQWVQNYVCKLPSGEIVAIYDDITDQKNAESSKKKLEKRIQQAQKMESIGNLAGGIAHDFNNILFPIIGMSELLLEDLNPGSRVYKNAREIFKAGKRGGELVKQILSFSRQSEQEMMPVQIQPILKEIVKLIRSTIPSFIEIEQEIQNDCGMIMADPVQLHQIVMNLVTNAYHALEQAGGKICLKLMETELEAEDLQPTTLQSGKYARLIVSDTGCGIESDIIAKIFEPYFTTKEKDKGTGLGLAVTYGIVKKYEGEIKVYSEVGQGTTFNIYFPLIENSDTAAVNGKNELPDTGQERVLLVDDEELIVDTQQQILERLGYLVSPYLDSIEALETFRTDPGAFDIVITDMAMPNMTGEQLAGKLKGIRPDIPIIISTGFSEIIDDEKSKKLGIKGFLMKPVLKSELARMVRKVLDEKNGNNLQG